MTHIHWMREALKQAHKAEAKGEVPVGAVLVKGDKLIAKAYNRPISKNDPTAHAEIIALRKAGEKLNNYRLPDTTLYVTLEPCAMCVGAIIHARVSRVVFGAKDPKTGALGGVFDLSVSDLSNHKPKVISGIMEDECANLLKSFFVKKRPKAGLKNI